MKRYWIEALLCLAICVMLIPLISTAQETPRSDPVGSAPEAANLPEATTRPSTRPTTRPAGALDRFSTLNGAVGFWRIGQDEQGVWWFISPDNKPEFLNTVTTVQPTLQGRDEVGPDYVSRDYDETLGHEAALDKWAQATLKRVYDTGFKGLGAWSHPVLHKHDVPMTRDLNVWAWLRARSLRLFTPGWSTVAESTIEMQVRPLRENRNLVGYYIDNELDWGDASSGPGFYFDHLASDDPNRVEVIKVIRATWKNVEWFNKDWETSIKDFAEIESWPSLPRHPAVAYHKLGSAWLYHMAEAYFRVTTGFIRKHDPNHLILGVRFRGSAHPEVVSASRGYTDAQSLNYYVSDAKLDEQMFTQAHELSGQPLIITEYSFHSLDGRSGNRNIVGFPGQVMDQQARGDAYRQFTTRLAKVPWVIGADWFQWMDEPPSGRRIDGEDVNFGIVDIDDRPYEGLAQAIRETTPKLNGLHEASARELSSANLWRDSYLKRPTQKAPYLQKPIRINGETSDWPETARVGPIRATETVGIERSKRPEPQVFLGWREDGLYLAMDVYDTDLSTAPAHGWWWSRDSIEFFVSTKPVPGEQRAYDEHCHHFFFVVNNFPHRDGVGGVVGQWHAPGDTLEQSLIPHPQVRNSVRVFPDRYVVEIFIPASALHGFDPAKQPQIAFNAHVRNHQHALEYFWSAPKQVITQARPNTWGEVYLTRDPIQPPTTPIAGSASELAPPGE